MSNNPDHLQYTKEHEWVESVDGSHVKFGITDFAQGALGDIVYVQLPKVGEKVSAGAVCGEVESTKSVSEIFAPVTGTVIEINDALTSNPEIINSDPYSAGWMVKVELESAPTGLLSSHDYVQITG